MLPFLARVSQTNGINLRRFSALLAPVKRCKTPALTAALDSVANNFSSSP